MYPGTWRAAAAPTHNAANLPTSVGTRARDRQVSLSAQQPGVSTLEDSSPCRGDWSVRPRPWAAQSQSARVPLSNRTACLGSHSTLSHRTARLTDRLHASPPYHDITTSTRNPSLSPCVPPNRPPLNTTSSSSSQAYGNRPQSLSSSPPTTVSDAQTPNCFGPTPSPRQSPYPISLPSRALPPVASLTAHVHNLLRAPRPSIEKGSCPSRGPVSRSPCFHHLDASILACENKDPLSFSIPTRYFDPDSTPDPPK